MMKYTEGVAEGEDAAGDGGKRKSDAELPKEDCVRYGDVCAKRTFIL